MTGSDAYAIFRNGSYGVGKTATLDHVTSTRRCTMSPDVEESYAGRAAEYIGGGLLVGFFVGPRVEAFDHAVVTAYRWPPEALSAALRSAGFDVLETHTRTGSADGPRPHGEIVARRRDDAPSLT